MGKTGKHKFSEAKTLTNKSTTPTNHSRLAMTKTKRTQPNALNLNSKQLFRFTKKEPNKQRPANQIQILITHWGETPSHKNTNMNNEKRTIRRRQPHFHINCPPIERTSPSIKITSSDDLARHRTNLTLYHRTISVINRYPHLEVQTHTPYLLGGQARGRGRADGYPNKATCLTAMKHDYVKIIPFLTQILHRSVQTAGKTFSHVFSSSALRYCQLILINIVGTSITRQGGKALPCMIKGGRRCYFFFVVFFGILPLHFVKCSKAVHTS